MKALLATPVLRQGVDGMGQTYIQFDQGAGFGAKRVWFLDRTHNKPEKDWAESRFYLMFVRCDDKTGNPGGNATDIPIYKELLLDSTNHVPVNIQVDMIKQFIYAMFTLGGIQLP